jgi:hypothetical protein
MIIRQGETGMRLTKTILLALAAVLMNACGDGGQQERNVPEAMPSGETSAELGDYIVHYNAMTTDQLTPEVAQGTDIVRSRNRAMLNVSFVEKTTGRTVEGAVDVSATNLTGQTKNITMREVRDGEAVYYIGEVPVAHRETLVFNIEATPPGADQATMLRFRRQFFTD